MTKCFDFIVEYLNQKQTDNFSGSIRLSFENGNLVTIGEANKYDIPTTANDSNDIVNKCLLMAKDPIFNGSIMFEYEEGRIIAYSYQKTYKKNTLRILSEQQDVCM